MAEQVAVRSETNMLEQVVIAGNLEQLSPADRLMYYRRVCESLGLNPLTQPFAYIRLNGKLTLYARRDATDQLRKIHGVSITIVSRERLEETYIVTARATLPDGRFDESIGAVSLQGLRGDNLANALMKTETKAKRRVTLSLVGLGWLDENEVVTVPSARPVAVNVETGEIEPETVGWGTWSETAHKAFWAKANELGLDSDAIHREFGVASMKDYAGSMDQAADVLSMLGYVIVRHSLTLDDLHNALGIDAASDYEGTPGAGKAAIDAYIAREAGDDGVEDLEASDNGEAIGQDGMPF